MGRSEPQFCRDQAERLLKLAKECDDPKCETTFASWHVSGWNGQRQKTSWEIGTCPNSLMALISNNISSRKHTGIGGYVTKSPRSAREIEKHE